MKRRRFSTHTIGERKVRKKFHIIWLIKKITYIARSERDELLCFFIKKNFKSLFQNRKPTKFHLFIKDEKKACILKEREFFFY